MAAASPRNPRRTKGRHRKPSKVDTANCAQWLRVGTVGIGLGAAIASGQGIASAAPDDSSGSGPTKGADTAASSTTEQGGTTGSTSKKAGPKRPPTTKVSGQGADNGGTDNGNDKDATGGSKADSDTEAGDAADAGRPSTANPTKRSQSQVKTKPRKVSGVDTAPSASPAPSASAPAADNAPAPAAAISTAPTNTSVTVSTVPAAAAATNTVAAGTVTAPGIFSGVADMLNFVGHGLEETLALAVRQTRTPKGGQSSSATTTTSEPPTTESTTTSASTSTGGSASDAPKAAAVSPISPQDAVATLTAAYSANNADELFREALQAGMKTTDLVTTVLAPVINAMNLIEDLSELGGAISRRDGVDVVDEIGDAARDLIGMVPVIGQPIVSALYGFTAPAGASATMSALSAAAAAAPAAASPMDDPIFKAAVARAMTRLAGWPGTPKNFVDVTNYSIDQSLDLLDTQLDNIIATAPVGSPARWLTDSLNFAAVFFTSAVPGYTFTDTLNAIGDFLNRIVPPFKIADGAGALGVISAYKIMGAAVAGTATVLKDMLNGVYDLEQIAIDVIYATTGATVTRSDLYNSSSLTTKVALSVVGGGGAYSDPTRAFNITLPAWTPEQVNFFTIGTYVALVAIYKRFQEMALLQTFTTSTTYDSWHYTNGLGMYAAGTFHAVDDLGRSVDFFGVSQGGTYTSVGNALVTINNSTGGFTYTPPAIWDSKFQNAAFFHRSTSENEADRYDYVDIPVATADGARYTITFKISIINGTNAAPTGSFTVTSTDGVGVVKGKINGSDADGDTLKYSLIGSSVNGLSGNSAYTKDGSGNGGIVTINPVTGDFTYVSSATASSTQSFQVMINDGHYGNTPVTVTVTNSTAAITPANVNTSTPYQVTGSVPSSTNKPGAFTSYALVSTTTPKGLVTSFDPTTGAFTYTRTSGLGHTTSPTDVVTVLATDANGRTVTLKLAVNPTVANASPSVVLTTAPTVGTLSGTTQTSTGKVTYSDPDGDSAVWPSSVTSARGGTVTFAADGSFTYTSNLTTAERHAVAKIGAAGSTYNGVALAAYEDAFTVTVSDGYGGTAQTTVKVPIYSINSAPTISSWTVTHFLVTIGTAVKVNDADGDLTSGTKPANGNPNNGNPWYTFSRSVNTFNWYGSGGVQDFSANGTGNITFTVGDGYYVVTNGVVTNTAASGSKTG